MDKRNRASVAHQAAAQLLYNVFNLDEIRAAPNERIDDFVASGCVVPDLDDLWAHEGPYWPVPQDARKQLLEAFTLLQRAARAVAMGEKTASHTLTVSVALDAIWPALARPLPAGSAAPWRLEGRLADRLIWLGLRLLAEVPRALLQPCALPDCSRIFVKFKNQKFCLHHQADAQRLAQRRALAAYRERERAKQKSKTTTTKRRTR